MGTVHAEITLKKARDELNLMEGLITDQNVNEVTVKAVVDTGAMSLVINEEIREKLDLAITGEKSALLANGQRTRCMVTEPVEVHWKNRKMTTEAIMIPGAKRILFGAIPLEGMDLMVNPVTLEVVGAHGEDEEMLLV